MKSFDKNMKRFKILIALGISLIIAGCYPMEDDLLGPGGDSDRLPKNGGFETSTDGIIPEFWTASITGDPEFNFFSMNEEEMRGGNSSLKIEFFEALSNPDPVQGSWGGLFQKISTSDWDKSKPFRLQYWYRTEIGNFQIRILKNGSFNNVQMNQNLGPTNTWLYNEISFNLDQDTEFIEIWISTKTSQANDGLVRAWLDDMRLLK
jgi:hypothetical protein